MTTGSVTGLRVKRPDGSTSSQDGTANVILFTAISVSTHNPSPEVCCALIPRLLIILLRGAADPGNS